LPDMVVAAYLDCRGNGMTADRQFAEVLQAMCAHRYRPTTLLDQELISYRYSSCSSSCCSCWDDFLQKSL